MFTRREVEEAATMAAGMAAGIFMARYPDEVMPSEELSAGVDRVMAELGARRDPEQDRIRATVDLVLVPGGMPDAGRHKLRVIIWSGPDFRMPSIKQGALFDRKYVAEWVQERIVEALGVLGVPVDGQEMPLPLLGGQVREGQQYPRLERDEAIDRLMRILDPSGSNEQLAVWAEGAKVDG